MRKVFFLALVALVTLLVSLFGQEALARSPEDVLAERVRNEVLERHRTGVPGELTRHGVTARVTVIETRGFPLPPCRSFIQTIQTGKRIRKTGSVACRTAPGVWTVQRSGKFPEYQQQIAGVDPPFKCKQRLRHTSDSRDIVEFLLGGRLSRRQNCERTVFRPYLY